MNKFAAYKINQIKQLQYVESVIKTLHSKYASELETYLNRPVLYSSITGQKLANTIDFSDMPKGFNQELAEDYVNQQKQDNVVKPKVEPTKPIVAENDLSYDYKPNETMTLDHTKNLIQKTMDWMSNIENSGPENKKGIYNSPEALQLMLGTAIQESDLKARNQDGGGPATGLFQMEKKTLVDLQRSLKENRSNLNNAIEARFNPEGKTPITHERLLQDPELAAIFARLQYARAKDKLPALDDLEGQAKYWGQYYHTGNDTDKIQQYQDKYRVHYPLNNNTNADAVQSPPPLDYNTMSIEDFVANIKTAPKELMRGRLGEIVAKYRGIGNGGITDPVDSRMFNIIMNNLR